MRFLLPKGCAGVSIAGRPLPVAPDRTVEVDPAHAAALSPHGLVPWRGPAETKVAEARAIDPRRLDTLTRAELVAALAARGRSLPTTADLATLRGALRRALAGSK